MQCERHMAALTIQAHVRRRAATLAPAHMRIARAYADSLMPRDKDGNLYTTCKPVEWAVYDELGDNIGLYMRFLWWGLQICGTYTPIHPNPARGPDPRFQPWTPNNEPST